MKPSYLIVTIVLLALSVPANSQRMKPRVLTTQLSKGTTPGNDYIQLVVGGAAYCKVGIVGDTLANISHQVIYDSNLDSLFIINGVSFPGIGSGKYRFPDSPLWDSIPYGTQILIYNDKNKNPDISIPDDTLRKRYNNFLVLPVSYLEMVDSLSSPSKDSIVPSPKGLIYNGLPFSTQEGVWAILNNYYSYSYSTDLLTTVVNDWIVDKARGNETPGYNSVYLDPTLIVEYAINTIDFNVHLTVTPPITTYWYHDTLTNTDTLLPMTECPRYVTLNANSSLHPEDVKYKWVVDGKDLYDSSGISLYSDSKLTEFMTHNTDVKLIATTTLDCITGNKDTVVIDYTRPSIKSLPPPIKTHISVDSTNTIYDSLWQDSIGNITITLKAYAGSNLKFTAHPDTSTRADLHMWIKNGIVVSYDTIYIDSNKSRGKDTIQFVVFNNLPCSVGSNDTTTIIANGVDELPITLSSLTATANNKNIITNWHTSTELNTAKFIIQHSTDGNSFTNIGTAKAIGSGANGYSFTDTHPINGTNYYRLESVDKDGASTFSKVVSVQFTADRIPFTVVPNPARDIVTINGNHITSVQVVDNIGRVVKTVSLKDATNPSLSVSGLPTGVYHLRVQTTDGKASSVVLVKE